MRVFVTGATGHIGSLVVAELIGAGHEVVGLARSDASAMALQDAGATAHRGALEDLDGLGRAAADADGVVHLAFMHGADVQDAAAADLRAIEAFGAALEGSDKPFVMTSGTAGLPPGRVGTEDEPLSLDGPGAGRARAENAAIALADRGVRVVAVRPAPSVHGPGDVHGFVVRLVDTARDAGASAYVGDGSNRWAAVDDRDAARLYRLALERGAPGTRLHAVGDEGVPLLEIADAIGRRLGVAVTSIEPARADEHFGFLGALVALDLPASNERTRDRVGWRPEHPGLLEDLAGDHYFSAGA